MIVEMDLEITPEDTSKYEIIVGGELHESWSQWLGDMKIHPVENTNGETMTILAGNIQDQAALRGTLNKIWDMHLTLISVKRVDAGLRENLTRMEEVSDE
jgi:hypothetical protein